MPRPSNPAARLVLDGQRTWVANQSIGGPIHGSQMAFVTPAFSGKNQYR